MRFCFCRFVLAALVIVFAWLEVTWGRYALTVIGALLVGFSLTDACCCSSMKKDKGKAKAKPKAKKK